MIRRFADEQIIKIIGEYGLGEHAIGEMQTPINSLILTTICMTLQCKSLIIAGHYILAARAP